MGQAKKPSKRTGKPALTNAEATVKAARIQRGTYIWVAVVTAVTAVITACIAKGYI